MNSLKFAQIKFCILTFLTLLLGLSLPAQAGSIEIAGSFSFSQNNYGNNNYQWTRRWGLSAGYTFWGVTEIEFSAQDVFYRTKVANSEDTTFHDQIYSVDWVQSFSSKNSGIQPYVKFGMGQMNRSATGSYSSGDSPPALYDSLTAIIGAGMRIYLVRQFALRGEVTSYLNSGNISTWQDNVSANGGVSINF